MSLSTYQIRIDNTRANIEKTRKTIERFTKTAEKRRSALQVQGIDLSDLQAAKRKAAEKHDNKLYFDICDYEDKLDDIARNEHKLRELSDRLQEQLKKYAEEEKRNDIPRIPVLEEFLSQWKLEAGAWYRSRTSELRRFNDQRRVRCALIREKYKPNEFRHRKEIAAEEKEAGVDYDTYQKRLHETFTQDVQRLFTAGVPGEPAFETALEELLTDAVQAMRLDLYCRCTAAVGVITDTSGLYVGSNGSLNGRVKGESGSAEVETIVAGGWNVQRKHFRVLIKPIQQKKDLSLNDRIKAAESQKRSDSQAEPTDRDLR